MSLLPLNSKKVEFALDALSEKKLNIDFTNIDVNPMTCPKKLLPFLAYQWRVNIDELTEEEQRKFIANALEIHRYKGTVYAVEKALQSVFSDSEIIEHKRVFEFDARVKLNTSTNSVYDANKFLTARTLVNTAKNARSRFVNFEVDLPAAELTINKTDTSTINLNITTQLDFQASSNIVIQGAVSWTL